MRGYLGRRRLLNTRLDSRGRILIPKHLRDELGLEPGTVLEIDSSEGHILLIPRDDEPELVWEDGVLVFTGKRVRDFAGVLDAPGHRRSRRCWESRREGFPDARAVSEGLRHLGKDPSPAQTASGARSSE